MFVGCVPIRTKISPSRAFYRNGSNERTLSRAPPKRAVPPDTENSCRNDRRYFIPGKEMALTSSFDDIW